MAIVGFNFTKMTAARTKPAEGMIGIHNNVSITDVMLTELPLDTRRKALRFGFAFSSKYDPDIGSIDLDGEVIYLADEKSIKETVEQWKKTKKVQDELTAQILNHVLMKSNVQALILSRDVNLPPPINLPKVRMKE